MKASKGFFLLILILALTSWPGLLMAGPNLSAPKLPGASTVSGQSVRPAYAPDELLIRFKTGYESKETEVVHKSQGQVVEHKQRSNLVRVKLPKGADLARVLAMYRQDAAVEFAEPNYIFTAETAPDDPYFNQQWALSASKLGMEEAWTQITQTTESPQITVAVIDTGVDSTHPDLSGKLVSGYNATTELPNDGYGHGTMVAGVIAATQGNSVGISGVVGAAPYVKIMPVKVLDSSGKGTLIDVAEGITWAADNGAKILNLSLGSSDDSQALRQAITHAYARGTLIIAAAGNNRGDVIYPAALPEVIAVSATDVNDVFWDGSGISGSNRGNAVDLSAPGVKIISTYPLNLLLHDGFEYVAPGYSKATGTSLAAPQVAGMAGLIASKYPGYSNDQIRLLLESTAKDLGTVGWDPHYGSGRVDAAAALKSTIIPPPGEPDDQAIGAVTMSSNASVQGFLQKRKDVDWYRVSYSGLGRIYVELDPPGGVDGVAEVYDGTGVLLGIVDNHSTDISDTGVIDIPAAGNYFIKIYSFDGSMSDQPYFLTVYDHALLDQWEPNDTGGDAKPIIVGQTVNAALSPAGDEDWYSLTINERGSLHVTVTPPLPIDPLLKILDQAGNVLESVDSNSTGEVEQVELPVEPGIYRINISDYISTDTGDPDFSNRSYTLLATLSLPPSGDLDGDMKVGIKDLWTAATVYGSRSPANTTVSPDLNGDGDVDLYDLVLISRNLARE
ncbi:MAG: S8 family serine peptidase [Bacillota bacterium]